MKKIFLMAALSALLCVSACNMRKNTEPSPSASPEVSASPGVTAAATNSPSPAGKTIAAVEKSKIGENWSDVGSYGYDIDSDGVEENIRLATSAETSGGSIMWDDGQQWVLEVSDGIETFRLFDEYVNNGSVYMDVSDYYKDGKTVPTITLIKSSGANLSIITYEYRSDSNTFVENVVLDSDTKSDGGINQRYSSIPYIE